MLKNGKPVKSSCFGSKVFETRSKEHGERALHPLHALFWAPPAPQKEDVEISIKNVTLQLKEYKLFYLRSGRIYCILAVNRLIGSDCLLFTQKFLPHFNKSPCLPRTHTSWISALSIQEFQLLDISPLLQHLSLVNTAIK